MAENKQRDMMHRLGYLTVAEVAEKVGRTSVTVYQWVNENKVVTRRVGRSIYILRASLKKYLGDAGAKMMGVT